jgi:hypothetical protein
VKQLLSQKPASVPCPDFQLAPLKALPPKILNGSDPVDRLVLVLALAFNDLKAVMWMKYQTDKCLSTPWTVSATNGQAFGFGIFVSRYLLGLMHELLLVVEKAHRKGHLKDKRFTDALALVPATYRRDWEALVSIATANVGNDPVRRYLLLARNQTAFHFDSAQLGKGYDDHFNGKLPDAPPESYAHAYVSLGATMEETRYYFADAAAAAVYTSVLDKNDLKLFKEADQHTKRLNTALRYVVAKYLLVKQQLHNAQPKSK